VSDKREARLAAKAKRIAEVRPTLSPLYLPYFDALCERLRDSYWFPYKGFRSLAEQAELYGRGRTDKSLSIVTNANAGDSPHNWGCATDWVEWRPEWESKDIWNLSDWSFYGDQCRIVNLRWGGDFKSFQDRPHNELRITGTWREIGELHRRGLTLEVPRIIGERMIHLGTVKMKMD